MDSGQNRLFKKSLMGGTEARRHDIFQDPTENELLNSSTSKTPCFTAKVHFELKDENGQLSCCIYEQYEI